LIITAQAKPTPTNGTTKIQGIVNDVSENGCGFVFKAKNDEVNVKKCDFNRDHQQPRRRTGRYFRASL
jgi:hypothetical protein